MPLALAIPIVVLAVLGSIVSVPVPVIAAPISIASVVKVRLLTPIVIVPPLTVTPLGAPVTTDAAVMLVVPRT